MLPTLPKDLKNTIYSYFEPREFLNLRCISKMDKQEIETTERYKKLKEKQEAISKIGNVSLQATIKDISPFSIHSNGAELRVLSPKLDKFWMLNSDSKSFRLKKTLPAIPIWNRVIWADQKLAICTFSSPSPPLTKYNCSVLDIEGTNTLGELKDTCLFPSSWYNDNCLLLNQRSPNSYITSLHIWKITEPPLQVAALKQQKTTNAKTCNNGWIYCLSNGDKPFTKLNPSEEGIIPLNYSITGIKNFGVTQAGNIYFSQKKTLFLISGESCRTLTTFQTPIEPSEVVFDYPLIGCFNRYRFLVYDARHLNQPLYDQNCLNLSQKIKYMASNSLNYFFGIHDFGVEIQTMTFHQSKLVISQKDSTLTIYDLATIQPWNSLLFNFPSLPNPFNLNISFIK